MKTHISTLALVFLTVLALPVKAQVDGFNKGKGDLDLVGSVNYEHGLGYYLADGEAAIKRRRIGFTLFTACGITDDLDVQLSLPFLSTGGNAGLQDAQFFVKYLPFKGRVGNGKLTFGAAFGGSTPISKYNPEGVNAIGQQATSLVAMGVLQYTFDNGWFASVVGGRSMVEAPTPDALIGTFRIGHASSKHYIEAYAQMQHAYGGKDYLGVGDQAWSTFRELGVSFLRVGGKYYAPISKRFGLVGEAGYMVAGRNVDRSVSVAGSFIVHFRK